MTVVKKPWFVGLSLVLALGVAIVSMTTANAAQPETSDAVKIASLVKDLDRTTPAELGKLEALPIRSFEIPPAGVDVMRARLTETYSVDGVGSDQVELSGWIAVRHGQARPVEGATELKWSTAILTTEFVGMDLQGHSDVFGPVRVRLDNSRRSIGSVGQIQIPAKARQILVAAAAATSSEVDATAACEAAANVTVEMPDLQLAMQTKSPVSWYSLVTTIPPVGHTASIAIEPVRLIANGREVATLESGKVNFRELVRHVRLSDDRIETASSTK
jgi:histone H3/H4